MKLTSLLDGPHPPKSNRLAPLGFLILALLLILVVYNVGDILYKISEWLGSLFR